MNTKYVSLALFGLVSFQAGADPQGTQEGVKGFFTSAHEVGKTAPILFNGDPDKAPITPAEDDKSQLITLPSGQTVRVPSGYRVVSTGG